jgi:flagella basal body P-ring formation protein FlgA
VDVAEGSIRLSPRPVDAAQVLRSRMLVWVDAWVGDRFLRSFPVTVEATGVVQRPPEARVAAGEPPLSPVATGRQPDAEPAVSRGDWAALRTTSGAVSLESRVEVQQDGKVGQRIRVRTSGAASGILSARVVGRGELELAP